MKRIKKLLKASSSPFFWKCVVEEEKLVLERESPTSLYISRLLDRRFSSGQEAKLVYATKATRGHRFCGVSTTPRGRRLLLLDLFFG